MIRDNAPSDGRTVLVVDDEPSIRRFLRPYLGSQGYRVIEAETGRQALALAGENEPDVILLDLGLPDMDGLEVLAGLSPWTRSKVVVISARGQESQKVAALDAGASDYLTKPFGLAELAARLRAVLRRSPGEEEGLPARVTYGDVDIDFQAHAVTLAGEPVHLTPTEYNLLACLVRHVGKVVTHAMLLREVWGRHSLERDHYVRIHVHKLRRKIEADPARPRHLHTETGVGYRFVP